MFHFFDADGSGELDRDEFLCLLNQLFPENCDENETYVDREFAAADADRSRTLSFVEFERYYPQLKALYERINQEAEAAAMQAEAEAAAAAAAAAAKAAKEAADAAAAMLKAKEKEEKQKAAAEAAAAKAAARAAAEEATRAALLEAEEEAARAAEEAAAIAASLVACACGDKFLPHLLAQHQRSCEACKPQKALSPPSSDEPERASVEFADNGANGFVPCGWCQRTFLPDRLAVHHRVCKAKKEKDREGGGIRPTMTKAGSYVTVGEYRAVKTSIRDTGLSAALAMGR